MAQINFENMQAVIAAGYVFTKSCGCGGTLTHKFHKSGTRFEIWVKPKLGVYTKLNDSVAIQSGRLSQIATAL